MKSTAAAILLLFLIPLPSFGFQLSGEVGFYGVNLKGDYNRELGLENWRGRKNGYYYRLNLRETFRLSAGTNFNFSAISGTTKVPYVNLFTSSGDSLFSGGVKTFNVRELYLIKRGFLFKGFTLKVGKQHFEVPALFSDDLWGAHFNYSFNGFNFFWDQIAGYEGKYLLPRRKNEDDVDIAVFGVKRKSFTFGAYRIMDAKGVYPAEFKTGLFFKLDGRNFTLSGVSQNGNLGGWGEVSFNSLKFTGGYWQKGITSYGYREDLKGEGLIFRPTEGNLRFGKVFYSFNFKKLPVSIYAARFETSSGKLIGNEAGGELDYPVKGGALFLKGALGSSGAYALFGGYRWGVRVPEGYGSLNVKLKNYFNVVGEYANFPQKFYPAQLEYEGWAKSSHVGFWHSTYKLTAYTDTFRFKVSTGRNSKFDYIVWGNTADNFLYQRSHGKLWHFEELYASSENFRLGLQPVSVKPLFSDYLPGISYRLNGFQASLLYHRFNGTRGSQDHGVALLSYRNLYYAAVFNGSSTQSALSFFFEREHFTLGGVKEWGYGHNVDWGAVFGLKGSLFGTGASVGYRVFSNNLSTFNLREFYRDVGLSLRPGERGVRYATASLERPLNFWKFSRFSTKLRLYYDRLYRFSGSYVAQEFGLGIILNPGKRCSLELLGGWGSSSIKYTGLRFNLSW